MPTTKVDINLKQGGKFSFGVKEVEVRQRQRRQRISNLSAPMTRVSIFLDSWVQRNFKAQGGLVGGWESFAEGGRLLKGGFLDTSAKLLQDSGRLRASFTPFATKKDAGIFSDLLYSEPHHKGLSGLPMRRMLPKKLEVAKEVKEILKQGVFEAIEK